MTITVEIDDHEWKESIKSFPDVFARAIELVALQLHGDIKRESPVDQGRLQGSWQLTKINALEYGISSNVIYRWMVNDGTPAHRIEPKDAKALHFMYKGEEVFCKWVDHPGTAANPYIDRAIESTYERLPEFADRAIREKLKNA